MAKYDYRATCPREIEIEDQKKTVWTNIGVGFKNKSGAITVKLNALPLGDTIVLVIPTDEDEKKSQKRF